MRLLVITPTLGTSQYLEQTVASIYRLDLELEHIVVCPMDVVNSVSSVCFKSRVISEPQGCAGMYAAINSGVRAALSSWTYLVCINDDDVLNSRSGWLSSRDLMGTDAVVYGRTLMIDANGNSLYEAPFSPLSCMNKYLISQGIIPFMQSSMVVPRSIIEKSGLFDESYRLCGDLAWITRSIALDIEFRPIHKVLSNFRIHRGQLSGCSQRMKLETARAKTVLIGSRIWAVKGLFIKIVFRLYNFSSYFNRYRSMRVTTSAGAFYGK